MMDDVILFNSSLHVRLSRILLTHASNMLCVRPQFMWHMWYLMWYWYFFSLSTQVDDLFAEEPPLKKLKIGDEAISWIDKMCGSGIKTKIHE